MPSAVIAGATGILGREIVIELTKHSEWTTIYALSRTKKDAYPEHVVHQHVDLSASVDEIAKDLKDIRAEYLFFAAYIEKDSEQEAWDVNGKLLKNFLEAFEKTGESKILKKIILVTGCKQYGVHLGCPKNPMVETDPWLRDDKWPPNFYYNQQDILHEYCERNSIAWVVTYPNDVIGFAKGNFMNLATSVGLYAAVSKEMESDLVFPGSELFYSSFDCFTYSKLHAQFCHWAVLESKTDNEAFNVVNGDTESWQNLWPLLAKRYGLKVKEDQFILPAVGNTIDLDKEPPISMFEKDCGLVGTLKPNKVEQRINLAEWVKKSEVQTAWKKLAEREGLVNDAFDNATWQFLNFVLGRNFPLVISMSKARKLGWTGYVDTWEAFSETFDELEAANILPRST